MAPEDPSRKRRKKLAARLPDPDLHAFLFADPDSIPFLYDNIGTGPVLMFWHAQNGPMHILDDDPVHALACLACLRRQGHPTLHPEAEIQAHATQQNCPRKSTPPSSN